MLKLLLSTWVTLTVLSFYLRRKSLILHMLGFHFLTVNVTKDPKIIIMNTYDVNSFIFYLRSKSLVS